MNIELIDLNYLIKIYRKIYQIMYCKVQVLYELILIN